jgi:hypothetical protein
MLEKLHLSSRLEPGIIARLNSMSVTINASINDTISIALDALEREQNAIETVTERVESVEKNLLVLVDSMTAFNRKIDRQFTEASFNEKERLKSLLKLLGEKIEEHDEAERARFNRFDPRGF